MVDVAIEHIGLASLIGGVNAIRKIDGTKSLNEISEIIINSVGNHLKNGLLLYTPIIKIIDTDGRDYILDDDFMRIKQPFSTNGNNSESKNLRVVWLPGKNTHPTQLSVKDASTQTDTQPQLMDECSSLISDCIEKTLESIKEAKIRSELAEIKKSEFDQYIIPCNNGAKNDPTEIPNDFSTDVLLECFKHDPSFVSLNQQNNSMLISCSNEQVLNPNNDHGNDSTTNQDQSSLKRPNQSEGDIYSKKRQKRIIKRAQSLNSLPTEMMCVSITIDIEAKFDNKPYDPSNVPVIFNFLWDKMIRFIHNIDQIKRERYLSESDKVPCIQRKKTCIDKSKDSILPVLELPTDYQQLILNDSLVLMGFVCVTECQKINGTGEIEFCLVGYKQFIYYSDEKEQMLPMSVVNLNENNNKGEQLIYKITKPKDGKNEYMLKAHPFKVKDRLKNEIGPVIFRLSAEYIQAAREKGFIFGKEGLAHRYAAYLFKYDEQLEQYIPDFESLGLSDYIFNNENEEE